MRPLALAALLLFSGCSTYAERVARTCTNMGFPPGSEHYFDCVQMREAVNSRDREGWGAMATAGASLMQQSRAPVRSATCSTVGGFTTCSGW